LRKWDIVAKILCGLITGTRMSPQARWPLITTSVSGILPETWQEFKRQADSQGFTYREAMEAAIRDIAAASRSGENIVWPHPKSARSRPVQLHHEVQELLHQLMSELGLKQNVIVLGAMMRWLERNGH
jgi:hypothetical protein